MSCAEMYLAPTQHSKVSTNTNTKTKTNTNSPLLVYPLVQLQVQILITILSTTIAIVSIKHAENGHLLVVLQRVKDHVTVLLSRSSALDGCRDHSDLSSLFQLTLLLSGDVTHRIWLLVLMLLVLVGCC